MWFFNRPKQKESANESSFLLNNNEIKLCSASKESLSNIEVMENFQAAKEPITDGEKIRLLNEFTGVTAPGNLSDREQRIIFYRRVLQKFAKIGDAENVSVPISGAVNTVLSTLPKVSRQQRLVTTTALGLGLFMMQVALGTLEEIYGEDKHDAIAKFLHLAEALPEVAEIFGYLFAIECKLISMFLFKSTQGSTGIVTGITIMAGVDLAIAIFLYHQKTCKTKFNPDKGIWSNINWLNHFFNGLVGAITVSGIIENTERVEEFSVDEEHNEENRIYWQYATLAAFLAGFSLYFMGPVLKQVSICQKKLAKQAAEDTMEEFKNRWNQREQFFNFLVNVEYDIGTLIQSIRYEKHIPIILLGSKTLPLLAVLGIQTKRMQEFCKLEVDLPIENIEEPPVQYKTFGKF